MKFSATMQSISNNDIINKFPDNFLIIQAEKGFFGSAIYRTIASDKKFVWKYSFCGSEEDLGPIEWPKHTEGFNIYELNNNKTYLCFKEKHLATAHISHKLLEDSTTADVLKHIDKDKKLILKSHDMSIHEIINCKIVRSVGSIKNITKLYAKDTTFRKRNNINIPEIKQDNLHNLNIGNYMSEDYEIFVKEYLKLCDFLDISSNINNVRQFILLMRDKLKRYRLTLP